MRPFWDMGLSIIRVKRHEGGISMITYICGSMIKYKQFPEEFLKEAKQIYPNTVLGKDGMSTELDFEDE